MIETLVVFPAPLGPSSPPADRRETERSWHLTDEISIKRILDHWGLSPPEREKPPPTREVVRVPLDDEGREIQAG